MATFVEQHADGDANTGAKGIVSLGDDGTNLQIVHTDSDGNLQVDVLSSALPTGAATQDTLSSVNSGIGSLRDTVDSMTAYINNISSSIVGNGSTPYKGQVIAGYDGSVARWLKATTDGVLHAGGDKAHDAADGGNPIKIGFKAAAHGTTPTAVAAGDRVDSIANAHGIPWMIGGHPNVVTTEWTFTSVQTNAELVTVAAGTRMIVTSAAVMVDADCTVNVQARLGLHASDIPPVSSSGVPGVVLSHPDIPPGAGLAVGTGAGILAIGADGDDLRFECDAPSGGSVRVVVTYYLTTV